MHRCRYNIIECGILNIETLALIRVTSGTRLFIVGSDGF